MELTLIFILYLLIVIFDLIHHQIHHFHILPVLLSLLLHLLSFLTLVAMLTCTYHHATCTWHNNHCHWQWILHQCYIFIFHQCHLTFIFYIYHCYYHCTNIVGTHQVHNRSADLHSVWEEISLKLTTLPVWCPLGSH